MLKKILLFGLMIIINSIIIVSAYEDKLPRIAYMPPYSTTASAYYPYFCQAVDTLGLTALIQSGTSFKTDDFTAAQNYHLNLINANAAYYSWGQYSMYQADRHNAPDYFQPPDPENQIRFLSTKLEYDNAGHGQQVVDSTVIPYVYAWFVSKNNPNDNRGYVLDSLWNDPNGIDYSREQDRDSGSGLQCHLQIKGSFWLFI